MDDLRRAAFKSLKEEKFGTENTSES
jgi:hypothetical protein